MNILKYVFAAGAAIVFGALGWHVGENVFPAVADKTTTVLKGKIEGSSTQAEF